MRARSIVRPRLVPPPTNHGQSMENRALSPQRPSARKQAMRAASSPLKPLRATLQNQGLLTPQGTFEDMTSNMDVDGDPAKTLISPPPESQTTARRAGSAPVERPKRKRAQTSLARVSEDEHSDHGEPSFHTPRPRRKPRKHPRPSPPLEASASPTPTPDIDDDAGPSTTTTTLLSPHATNPEADYIPPVPATALSRAAIRRARSSTPGRGYSPPRERFTPPRVIIATPSPTKPTSTTSRAAKARPSALTIKKEPPEIDLSKPAPPPSPSDDPILLRARRRARKAASEEPTPGSKKSRSRSGHVRRASDEGVESERKVDEERADARDYFMPREVERVEEDVEEEDEDDDEGEEVMVYRAPSFEPEPVYDEPAPPRAASIDVPATPAHAPSDSNIADDAEEEPPLSYTGRFTQTRIPTAADPPTSTTRARRERWGRPVSPFPKKHPLGRLPEGEDEDEDGGERGEVPHFEDDEQGEEDMELDETSFARERVGVLEDDDPIPPEPAHVEEEEDDMESMYADPPAPARAPTPPRRHAPVAETPALPTRTEPLEAVKSAPMASDMPRSPLLPSRSAGSARSPWLSLASASGTQSSNANAQGSSDSGYDSRSPEDVEAPVVSGSTGTSTTTTTTTTTQPHASSSGSTSTSERTTLMAPPRRVPSPSKPIPPASSSSPAPSSGSTASPRPPRRVALAEKPPVYSPLVARLSSGAAGSTPRKSALEGLAKRRGVRELVEQHASEGVRERLWSWDVPAPGERVGEVPATPSGTNASEAYTSALERSSMGAGPSTLSSMPPPATPLSTREQVHLDEPETPTPEYATPTPAPRPISTQAPRAGPSTATSVSSLARRFSLSPDTSAPAPTTPPAAVSFKGKEKELFVVPAVLDKGKGKEETRTANEKGVGKGGKLKSILKKPSRASVAEREQDERDEAVVDVLLTPQKGVAEGGVRFRQDEDDVEEDMEEDEEEMDEEEEDVEVQDADADSDDGDSSDPGEGDASVIKIVSDDPWQAARAAAILKQHEYDLIPFAPRRRRLDLQTLFKRTNRAMLSSSGISKSKFKSKSESKPVRELRGVVLDGTVVTPGSPAPLRTREDLFADADRSLSHLSHLSHHDAAPTPVDAYRTPSPSLSVSSSVDGRTEIDTAGPRPWARADWKLLDACITDERMALSATPGALADVDAVDLDAVVGRFVAFFEHSSNSSSSGGYTAELKAVEKKGLERMGAGWTVEEMLARARALLKKHRAGTPAPPTPEGSRRASPVVPDFTPVKLPAPAFEGRKGLGLNVGGSGEGRGKAAMGMKMPGVLGAPRYAHLLSEARSIAAPPRRVVEVEKEREADESVDMSRDASMDLSTDISMSEESEARPVLDGSTSSSASSSTGDDSHSQDASTSDTSLSSSTGRLPPYLKDAPSPSLGARVKSFFSLSSYLPRTPAPSKSAPNTDTSRALPPPPEPRSRGPIITPISKPIPAPAHPKDLVELDHVPTPAPAQPSRIPIPKRLVDLRHVEPEPRMEKKLYEGPPAGLKKRGSVQDLVGLFESVQDVEERRVREGREERFGRGLGVGKLGVERAWKP
ncbi:unnamed protein product [Peniophora sp. CBMAI 1063]|nr:unnamed protein product [Peniophora sp. CBMAI 1063]